MPLFSNPGGTKGNLRNLSPLQGSYFAFLFQGFALVFDDALHPWLISSRSLRSAGAQEKWSVYAFPSPGGTTDYSQG